MRKLAIILTMLASPAVAQDKTVPVTQLEAANFAQIIFALDQCVGSAFVRGDAGPCRSLSAFLAAFAQKIAAVQPPTPPASTAPPAKPEAPAEGK